MVDMNFVIPQTKNDLLSHASDQYFVRDVIGPKEIYSKLKVAKQCLRDEGPDFILDNFDVYFSIFLRPESHTMETMMMSYLDLHKAVTDLNKNIGFILEDKEILNEEIKAKYQNILKILLYVYTNMVITIEHKIDIKRQNMLQSKARGKKKSADSSEDEGVNKKAVVLALNNIMDREINLLWDPPVVEEVFVNMVSEVFYRFLEFPSLKSDRELRTELFNAIGILIKRYNHGMTFNVRITQLIKLNEHLMYCIPEGIQILVNNYNCKGLVRNFIREITEWQTDENYQDSQGTKFCSGVLTEMAKLMPDLMIPEVMYLNQYLAHDSYTLRNSVLNVITEVVLTVLSKNNLSEEERDSRDELLELLEEHIYDTSSHVRTKVVQHWATLQKENAIPLSIQNNILEKIVGRLYDKAALVRKNAANCVSTFLTHNIYGAELQLSKMEKELQQKQDDVNRYKGDMCQNATNKLKEVDEEWVVKEEKLREVIMEKLQEERGVEEEEGDENNKKDEEDNNLAVEAGIPARIREFIVEEKYDEAFDMCRLAVKHLEQWQESSKNIDRKEEAKLFLVLMKTIFYGQGCTGAFVDIEANFTALEKLESHVQFLTNCVGFLRQIDKAIRPMKELLESASVGDMQEAVDFFVTAFQFKIENALDGVLAMLRIMQRSEQDRKEYVVNAFKTIYLTTDTKSMKEHTTTIVDRLIHLLKTTPYDSLSDFSLIVTEWTSKGILDNNVIDALWQCFTKQRDVSEDDSRAAIDLLAMAAKGRKTIISKNLKMIATVAFTERGEKDLLFLASACRLMAVAGTEKQNMADKNPPFRIKIEDPIWTDLMSILEKTFFKADPFYPMVTSAAAELTYKLCSKPEQLWEEFIEKIVEMIVDKFKDTDTLPKYVIIQCGHLFGEVAIKELHFLDEAIYKELKRRQLIREEKNDKQKNKTLNRTILANASSSRRKSRISEDTDEPKIDEGTLEGVQAGDPEAEFILNVLENNIVTGNGLLQTFAPLLVMVCERPDIYDCFMLQGTFSVALLRYMLVSSRFCEKNLQLVFTMLEKTKFSQVKINIMIHLCDLLERFPNIVEPWTPNMYERLKDSDFDVRINTFYLLSNLILRDMIRIQGHIAKMARCLVDDSQLLKDMSKNFFTLLSHRANNLYNVLPDIFSHLIDDKELEEEQTRHIMQFLFSLIEKNKHMENLVERFCLKLSLTEEKYICRNITYCLSLIQYTDRGLRKLIDSFQMYKRFLEDNEVYAFFKQIINTCNKNARNEVKALATELEEKINSAFDTDKENDNEDGVLNSTNRTSNKMSQKSSKTPFKKPRGRALKKKARKQRSSDEEDGTDSDSNEDKENNINVRKSTRTRPIRKPKKCQDSDSDSD